MQLLDLLHAIPALQSAEATLQKHRFLSLSGVPSPAWAVVAGDIQRRISKPLVFIAPTDEAAENVTNDLRAILDESGGAEVFYYPEPDRSRGGDTVDTNPATPQRLAALEALHASENKALIIVGTVTAFAQPTLPPNIARGGVDVLAQGQTLDREKFIEHLAATGFERVVQVEAPGQFAARGGLVDFFPPASPQPVRVELFGDEIDSLRLFDVDTQRSTDKIQTFQMSAPREVFLSRDKGRDVAVDIDAMLEQQLKRLRIDGLDKQSEVLEERVKRDIDRLENGVYFPDLDAYAPLLYPEKPTLLEHLPADSAIVWADPERARNHLNRVRDDWLASNDRQAEAGESLRLPMPLVEWDDLQKRASKYLQALFGFEEGVTDLDIHLPPSFGGKLEAFVEYVENWNRKGNITVVSSSHGRRVREILADHNVRRVALLDAVSEAEPSSTLILTQRLAAGFYFANVLVLTDTEIFGWQPSQHRLTTKRARKKVAAKQKSWGDKATALTDLADLREGDFVVHINHGIARYAGVTRRQVAGAENDYMLLEYEGADRLYVPVGQLDRVQKYLGQDAAAPPLTSLKSGSWDKAKKKVKEETQRVAKELASLYAAREQAEKEPVAPDSPWQREMESAFPYEETPSQLAAIRDAKRDLETERPMDRLVCGDVGFGKTEVAVRAAFKVAQDGKQVAILVPTTVLAQQHYQTFAERLAPYPVRVEVLSRFRTPSEMRKVIEDVRLGAVDILVGTHRLLQQDLQFRNLGLVIVDEEQRFGVMQKERLKEMRKSVDILTLSATPIPRTLQFALGGMREISLITDPPRGRLPVRTLVGPYRDEQVRVAIERELERDGQVYYVHNRVGSIFHIAERIRQLVPSARIGVGHGQMGDEELEQVMLDFMHRRTDVLIATTIIENGLDLPNANTIIVDRAELLGLSQMYQLRGRVGRSSRQAYSYFFYGSRGKLSETSEERFSAIREHTDLGAGFKIAMRDLEIRGAGDVLGLKQSGSISSVGFELYTEMLREAVAGLRNEPIVKRDELPEADLPVPAFLPQEYVAEERDRLSLYRKMSHIEDEDDIKSLQDELRDRFGPLPAPAFNLIRILRIRLNLLHSRMRGISKSTEEVLVRLKPGDRFADEDIAAVQGRVSKFSDKRLSQHIALRPLDGFAVDTRALTALQVLRVCEELCETLANVRAPRLHGAEAAREARKKRKEEAKVG